jgi:CheY-like chemotaxis protein
VKPVASILVVEDDPDCREAIAEYLDACGFAVETAANGEEALRALRARPCPDLLLADLKMPRMGGDQLVAEVRRDARLARISIVVMTGSIERERPGAADALLHKPFSPGELVALLERVLDEARAPTRACS